MPKSPKLDFAQHDVLMWGAIGLAGVVAVYLVIKVVIPQLTKAAGDAAAGVASSVANIPAGIAHAAITGTDNLISEFTTPFANWWAGLDAPTPTPVNAGQLASVTNSDLGGANFGAIDGATW